MADIAFPTKGDHLNIRRSWRAAAAAWLLAALAACGGTGTDETDLGQVRVVNATSTHASLSLLVNSTVAISAIAKDSVSAYVGVDPSSPILQLNDAAAAGALTTVTPALSKNKHYTLIAFESGGSIQIAVLNDEDTLPAAGTAQLRIFDAASDAGAVDVYVTAPATSLATVAPTFSVPAPASAASAAAPEPGSFLTFNTGTYRVRVTGSANVTDLRLDFAPVTLASQQLHTVILTAATGGVLVDGGSLAQQGSYTPGRNTSARVRLVAAVSGGASVGATSGSVTISAPTTSPAVGSYAVVAASDAPAVSVNGASVPVPVTSLQAGSDATLLVYGSPAAPTVSVLADDNHLPISATTLKMRLVNGLTGAVAPLTLSADFGDVATNVQPGSASGYGVVIGSTTMRLDVTSASSSTALYSESNLNIPNASVFSLFMLGDAGAPVHVLRRDH